MYRASFPKCTIAGDQNPSSMLNHLGVEFAVPKKCLNCKGLFEGECTRNLNQKGGLLRLDTGACGIHGITEPIAVKKTNSGNELFIPQKCASCQYLYLDNIRGYVCSKDNKKWGNGFRDLDWGDWTPDYPNIGLTRYKEQGKSRIHLGQAIVTEEIVKLLQAGQKIEALNIYKKLNKIETIKEAKEDIEKLELKLS